jgi:osmotically-inducible protein OsmY
MVDLERNQQPSGSFTDSEAPDRWRGRGPRTYRRRDESIREEICESLTENPDLDADGIEVSVDGGEVSLTGTAESRDARWLAEDLAEAVTGVRTVHNNLRVAHG